MPSFARLLAILILALAPCTRADASDQLDPRVLATISVPRVPDFSFDASEDGNTLYIVVYGAGRASNTEVAQDETANTEFSVYDVSDAKRPRLISSTSLGNRGRLGFPSVIRGNRAFVFHRANAVWLSGVTIIDVENSAAPEELGRITFDIPRVSARVSDEGQWIMLSGLPRDLSLQQLFLNVADPKAPARLVGSPILEWESGPIDHSIPGIPGEILDRRGGFALYSWRHRPNGPAVWLYDVSRPDEPRLVRTLPVSPTTGTTRILPSAHAIAFAQQRIGETAVDGFEIVLYSTEPLPFEAGRLREIYQKRLEEYRACIEKTPYSTLYCLGNFTQHLADAGIDTLLDRQPARISAADRIVMLNDYGFALSRQVLPEPLQPGQVPYYVDILRGVVKLAPRRAVAWLNLGDAEREAIHISVTTSDKLSLARSAIHSYQTYHDLTGRTALGTAQVAAFLAAPPPEDNLCGYVLGAFEIGRLKDISTELGTVATDSGPVEFRVEYGGSASVPAITASTSAGLRRDDPFFMPTDLWGRDYIEIVPFKGVDYVAYTQRGLLISVVQPNVGPRCQFTMTTKPVLTENHSPQLCERLLEGDAFKEIPSQPLADGQIPSVTLPLVPTAFAQFTRQASITVERKPAQIGLFSATSAGGAGCQVSGLAFLSGSKVEESARNEALLKAQQDVEDCRTSTASLVETGGSVMVKLDGITGPNHGTPTHILEKIVGDRLEAVCKVDQQPVYKATFVP